MRGSPYQGDEMDVKGLRFGVNSACSGKHDRMHQHNLSYKAFMAKFRPYARVIEDYRKLLAFFSTSTKKLRRLKGEEVDLDVDVLKEMDRSENLYIDEVKNRFEQCQVLFLHQFLGRWRGTFFCK